MKYYLQYQKGLVKSDKADESTLHIDFGSHYHKFMEKFYCKEQFEIEQLWSDFEDREDEEVKTRSNGINLCRAYAEHYRGQDEFEVLELEKPYRTKIGGYEFIVKRDGVIRWNNNIYGLEHKTTGRLTSYYFQNYFINSQISAQTFVTHESHKQCSGVLLNVAQPSFVTKPVLLLPNDPETKSYSNVEVKHCKYYKEERAYCSGFYAKFGRDIINRTKDELDDWITNAVEWIKQIEETKVNKRWLKSDSGYQCKFCQYKEICKVSVAMNLDEDVIETLYLTTDPMAYLTEEE